MPPVKIQPPTGTRDLYPLEAAKRRFITEAWRKVSINHGFEEIDGPTFEHLELYTVKSGEGIVSELFSFTRAGGEKDYALRPEFTPTLARMYAARANSLPKPTKWFSVGPYFRAERPQRGRLREFLQWNCDVIGDGSPQADAELVACCIGLLSSLGLTHDRVQVRYSHRAVVGKMLARIGVPESSIPSWLVWIDRHGKLNPDERIATAASFGGTPEQVHQVELLWSGGDPKVLEQVKLKAAESGQQAVLEDASRAAKETVAALELAFEETAAFETALTAAGVAHWCRRDARVVRGLAYYTGMVFEVIVDGERAVAGGGRYDNLIELFGGPPTPAVGFGMGDVVLSLVLQDKGLMPSDAELLEKAGLRPDVFVIADAGRDASDDQRAAIEHRLRPTVAALRSAGLHARHSYKSTKNIGKLLEEASKLRARFAVIIDSPQSAKIKDLTTNTQDQSPTSLIDLPATLKSRLRTG